MPFFYKPDDGVSGDFIPFYWQGDYHLFYLKDYRDPVNHGEGTPWFHLSTRDFVQFVDYGEALPRGSIDQQDLYVFTGCVFEHQGTFHIFYTGHNPHFRAAGKPEQAVMHATSADLIHWQKDPANPILFADPARYEPNDWRDPFVFWNEAAGEFWMLLAARAKSGANNRRGVTALVTSPDLVHWSIRDPFWSPNLYYTHECPDLFQIGDWWYLVYSTFSERCITHYRASHTLSGAWTAPTNDSFDGRAFYAAKTAGDGQRRFAFGWNPTRSGSTDTGSWNWGGNLVVHEIDQQPDGALTVKAPAEVVEAFSTAIPFSPQPKLGNWQIDANEFRGDATNGFAWCRLTTLPANASMIETQVQIVNGTRAVGILLRADDTLDHYYLLQIELGRQRVIFERYPRPGDEPPMIERPLQLANDESVTIRLFVEDTVIVAYVNDQIALNARGYELVGGSVGLCVVEGSASFVKTGVFSLSQH